MGISVGRGSRPAKSVVGFHNWNGQQIKKGISKRGQKDKWPKTYWTSHDVVQRPRKGKKEEGEADRKEERCKKDID